MSEDTREELVEMAESLGIEVTEDMGAEDISDAIEAATSPVLSESAIPTVDTLEEALAMLDPEDDEASLDYFVIRIAFPP